MSRRVARVKVTRRSSSVSRAGAKAGERAPSMCRIDPACARDLAATATPHRPSERLTSEYQRLAVALVLAGVSHGDRAVADLVADWVDQALADDSHPLHEDPLGISPTRLAILFVRLFTDIAVRWELDPAELQQWLYALLLTIDQQAA